MVGLGWIWSGQGWSGMVRASEVDLGWIWHGSGVDLGWSGHGRVAKIWCGGREDAEKASKCVDSIF